MYGSETMLQKKKERPRIRAVQMDNIRGLLGIRSMDKGVVLSDEEGRQKD